MTNREIPPDSIAAMAALARRPRPRLRVAPEGPQRRAANGSSPRPRYTHPRSSIRKGPLVAVAFAAALAAALAMTLRPSLHYEVSGAALEGPYVSALPSAPAEVRFSDGSTLEAAPGSRLRVDETHSNGARVLVEKGRPTPASPTTRRRAGHSWRALSKCT